MKTLHQKLINYISQLDLPVKKSLALHFGVLMIGISVGIASWLQTPVPIKNAISVKMISSKAMPAPIKSLSVDKDQHLFAPPQDKSISPAQKSKPVKAQIEKIITAKQPSDAIKSAVQRQIEQIKKRKERAKKERAIAKKKLLDKENMNNILREEKRLADEKVAKEKARKALNLKRNRIADEKKQAMLKKKEALINQIKENNRLEQEQESLEIKAIYEAQLGEDKQVYALKIKHKILSNWTKDYGQIGWQCQIIVHQTRTGAVQDFDYGENCAHNEHFRLAIKKAVYRSVPLPVAPTKDIFESVLYFTFIVE
jgi:hypothetical protein